ncbi:bacteriohemerythrin [Roseospira goensis]|uniref:Hemerythrin n=1 Tax=Roseospira goensis TaxID=391922 RepID=A0A7W6WMJ0_9PROT|nr:bacteriohemerythrin [Roseospira goensis]MBB4287552.1 hemerythrin [Roseospira goensis]
MALIEWTPAMSVGVEALDEDHRRLIALLNQLDAVARGEPADLTAGEIVHELVRYTEYHFAREERLMRLSRYPDTAHHVAIHRDIRRRMVSFEQKFLSAPPDAPHVEPLLAFLSEWLRRHILGEDMQYRPYMTGEATPDGTAPTSAA